MSLFTIENSVLMVTRFAINILLFYFVLKIVSAFVKILKDVHHFRNFPHEPGSFIFGDIRKIVPSFPFIPADRKLLASHLRNFLERNVMNKSPRDDLFVAWIAWFPLVLCTNHRSIAALHIKPAITKPIFYKFFGLKDGLVVSNGTKWKQRRKMTEPFFVTKRLQDHIVLFDKVFSDTMNQLGDSIDKPIDLCEIIHSSTLDIICELTLSIQPKDLKKEKGELIEFVSGVERCLMERALNPLQWNDWLFGKFRLGKLYNHYLNIRDSFFSNALNRRLDINSHNNNSTLSPGVGKQSKVHKDLVELLMKHADGSDIGNKIDLEGLNEEILNIVAAGHESTANGLSWTLFLFGNHQEIQSKLLDEIINVFPEGVAVDDLERLNGLTYLDQCVKESLRMFPPVPITVRELEEDVQVGSRIIPKHSNVAFLILAAQRDPSVFPDPERFDPSRFAPENAASIPKYAFMPFEMGPRNCIGQRFAIIEMKVFFIHVLRRFHITSMKTMDEVTYEIELGLKPSCPLELKLRLRDTLRTNCI